MEANQDVERVYQGNRLYNALLAYSRDSDVARESVAEAFARAIASSGSIRELVPWVWRVAFRLAAEEMKRRGRFAPLGDAGQSPYEPPALFEALSQLSERQRAAVLLHYYAGYSLDEIAAILGTRKGTVGVHLHRGRARLMELLEAHDG